MRPNKRTQLEEWLADHPGPVTLDAMPAVRDALAPVSDSYLRKLLKESGAPLAPLVEGVRQDSLENLERTLLAVAEEYAAGQRAAARKLVIEAKDRARFALKRATEEYTRALRQEALLWMMTWLENPEAFPVWLRLRRR